MGNFEPDAVYLSDLRFLSDFEELCVPRFLRASLRLFILPLARLRKKQQENPGQSHGFG